MYSHGHSSNKSFRLQYCIDIVNGITLLYIAPSNMYVPRMRMGFMKGTMMTRMGSGFKKENSNPLQTNCSSLSHS